MKKTLTLLALLGSITASALANETIWVDGITPDNPNTYYAFTKGGYYDSPMCWAISAASVLAWWEDRVEASGALIMPKDMPRGADVWPALRDLFKSRGGQTGRAYQFWLSGDTQYSNNSQWLTEEGFAFVETGGYFPRLAGTHYDFDVATPRPSGCMTYTLDMRGFSEATTYENSSKILVQLLKDGYGAALNTGSHAMAMFGVEADDEGNVVKVWYDDNNTFSDNAEMGELPHSASVYRGENRKKEGETVDRYSTAASIGYDYAISGVSLIRTKGIQFTDYDVRVGENFDGKDEFLFSHYCNLLVDGSENYELKYDLRDASAEGSPVDPILTTYDQDGKTELDHKKVSTGNLSLMDGTVTLVDATGDTAKFDKGGSVEGIVSFEHSDKAGTEAARKLSVKRDGAAVGELAVKTNEGTNTLEVAADKKLTIGKLSGEGNLNKTGLGVAEVRDAVTLNGEIRVKEGDFIFGQNVVLTDKTVLTVSNGANVQGKEGQPLSLSITSGVQVNDGVLTLTTTITGGTLKGSGSFANVTVDGGTLIVGNSPGQQTYTGNLDVNAGDIVFSVSDWGAAATDQLKGWSNGVYSNINMVGDTNALTLGGDSKIRISLGNTALDELTSGKEGSFSMDLVTGIDNVEFFSSDLLNQLAKQTLFFASDELGALPENLDSGSDLNSYLRDMEYSMNNGVLTLKGSYGAVSPVPEPATGTLSLLALAGLCARRRRK